MSGRTQPFASPSRDSAVTMLVDNQARYVFAGSPPFAAARLQIMSAPSRPPKFAPLVDATLVTNTMFTLLTGTSIPPSLGSPPQVGSPIEWQRLSARHSSPFGHC